MDLSSATKVMLQKISIQLCTNSGPACTLRGLRALSPQSSEGLDLVFLLDGSASVPEDDFQMGLRFTSELLEVLAVSLR